MRKVAKWFAVRFAVYATVAIMAMVLTAAWDILQLPKVNYIIDHTN